MNVNLVRTDSGNADFRKLVAKLDAYLSGVNGETDDFFRQFNTIDKLTEVVVAYADDAPAACGAIRAFGDDAEVKRMYVDHPFRRRGLARRILEELETWSRELGYTACVLETSKTMEDAVNLYLSCGYTVIPNYGPYQSVESSLCLRKPI